MKKLVTILSLLSFISTPAMAGTSSTVNDLKRDVKKQIHRGDEKICEKTGGKNCDEKKARHKDKEKRDWVKDKINEPLDENDLEDQELAYFHPFFFYFNDCYDNDNEEALS